LHSDRVPMSQAVGRVVLLLTGGAAGSALWQNKDSLDDVPKQLLQAILGMRTNGGSDGSGLDRKVDNLAQEMRMMMSRSNQGTVIVQSGSSWSFSRIIYLILPGAGVYYYMKWKGYSLADLQWVSSTRFSQAVEAMKTAQEALSIKLNDFRTTAHQVPQGRAFLSASHMFLGLGTVSRSRREAFLGHPAPDS